ncbi:hypothetical protein ES319_D11G031200v1 [Gossypium barbadense]|uniref:Uncharacterized protein n=2 Tax=Gossypium TaxID=3633 RepID=A0A5J5P6X0_GOSBA|nr:hypothetical protein ES319_D11G031200v1 [Gossypium barbadense]TYG43626.1 hypothetical protein ES288_D11G032600v1 [Gossypium darwinii]
MAFYVDEEEVWKCPKHPSKRRRSGVCPFCLRDKLASLCPDCAHYRPCACSATSSSSSSSSSFYRFLTPAAEDTSGIGSFGRGSNLTGREPTFRRSRSLAVRFLLSKPERLSEKNESASGKCKTPSFWSMFKASKKSKRYESEDRRREEEKARIAEEERMRMMRKSRSVLATSHSGIGISKLSPSTKAKSWYFPSPMKVFRQTRGLVFQERSPLYRG